MGPTRGASPSHVYNTPLSRKLGIGAHSSIALIAPPDNLSNLLGNLPEGSASPRASLLPRTLPSASSALARTLPPHLIWSLSSLPLPPSGLSTPNLPLPPRAGFNQNDVRNDVLAADFVDFKICSIDTQWSAVKFTRRKPQKRWARDADVL